MNKTKRDRARKEVILSMRAQGKNYRQIGEAIGLSTNYTWELARKYGEPRSWGQARRRTERQMIALALRARGLTFGQIAKKLGIARCSAHSLVKRAREARGPNE